MQIARRELLLAGAGLGIVRGATGVACNAARLRADLEALSVFGRPSGGTFADGVTRTGYSDADIAGRNFVMGRMKEAGLAPRIDAAGNIFGRREGTDSSLQPVLFGSHIDSVRNGGNFDGDLGVLASLEILRLMNERGFRTKRALEMVVWACEEASFNGWSLNGSRAAAGKLEPGELDAVSEGRTKREGIRRIGGNPEKIEEARIARGAYHAYLEMHIEQGGTLERERVPVGVVEGIVAIDDYEAVIEGMANHAGTTPMAVRKDALLAASHLTIAVREIVMAEQGRQVGTVGHLEVHPNATNVVPGRVTMSIEMRDLSEEKLTRMGKAVEARAARIGQETGVGIRLRKKTRHEAAPTAAPLQRMIEDAAGERGWKTMRLPSGAGHDAQMMALLCPMGMIFVPSIGGISHSPKELTSWEDCARGADVLLGAVLGAGG